MKEWLNFQQPSESEEEEGFVPWSDEESSSEDGDIYSYGEGYY
jgi:hypothetical protein